MKKAPNENNFILALADRKAARWGGNKITVYTKLRLLICLYAKLGQYMSLKKTSQQNNECDVSVCHFDSTSILSFI